MSFAARPSATSPNVPTTPQGVVFGRGRVTPPTLALFTASFPSPPASAISPGSSASTPISSFIPPRGGLSLAARRLSRGRAAPTLFPKPLSSPSLEEEVARLPELLDRLSLKRKNPPAALNMSLEVRKKARYVIVVDGDDNDEPSPNGSPVTPQPQTPLHIEMHTPPPRRPPRLGPKKRVRFADELNSVLHIEIKLPASG